MKYNSFSSPFDFFDFDVFDLTFFSLGSSSFLSSDSFLSWLLMIFSSDNYAYKKVFKYKNKGGKKNVELIFFFREEDDKYIITLEPNDKIFIYDLDLKKGHKFLDSIPIEIINQKVIGYQEKFDLFLEALEQNNEENKNERLYEETIDIISKKGNFSLLISLFTKI